MALKPSQQAHLTALHSEAVLTERQITAIKVQMNKDPRFARLVNNILTRRKAENNLIGVSQEQTDKAKKFLYRIAWTPGGRLRRNGYIYTMGERVAIQLDASTIKLNGFVDARPRVVQVGDSEPGANWQPQWLLSRPESPNSSYQLVYHMDPRSRLPICARPQVESPRQYGRPRQPVWLDA